MFIGMEIDGAGAHPAAWRRAGDPPIGLLDPRRLVRVAEIAERAGLTFVTLADDLVPPGSGADVLGRIGSIERAAYLSSALSLLAVVPGVPATYTEPFHVSSQLATIDHVTEGRSGWLVTTSPELATARAWGRRPVTGASAIRREAVDSVRVVRALWDSWEDDAVVRDITTSRYLDRDRLHYIDFVGEAYSIKGPAIVPRPPQGQLVVFAGAGLVPDDLVDVALFEAADVGALRARVGASRAARSCAEVEIALDTPDASGPARLAALEHHAPWVDRGRLRHVGSAAGLVERLRELAGVVDAVRLHPLVLDEDLSVVARLVVPPLVADRTVGRPGPGATLRTTLGLPRPRNRFETAADDRPAGPAHRGALR